MKWIYPDSRGRIMLKGYCGVNIKRGGRLRVYNRRHMNEQYRPIFPSEKKLWKLRNEPRGFEYKLIPLWQLEGRPEPGQQPEPEEKMSALGVLGFLALWFLSAILDLPEPEGSAIDGEGKIETPQSSLIAKS